MRSSGATAGRPEVNCLGSLQLDVQPNRAKSKDKILLHKLHENSMAFSDHSCHSSQSVGSHL